MAGEWQETTLGALGSFRNGVNFNRSQEGLGLAVVKVKDFGERFFAPRSGYDELDPNAIDITESQLLHDGDVVIIRSNGNGNLLGRSLYVREPAGPLTFSGFCIRFRPNSSEISPGFAAYLIRSPFFRRRFTAFGSGTGIQNLSQEILGSVPVSLPPLPEQRAIAHILGTLDDKIELNRKMNETLEAMARAIFKSWFVDFDPVRAKMEGRWRKGESLPGLPVHLWDLFPDRLVDSELGKIPEGWRVSTIGAELTTLLGGTPSRVESKYWDGGTIPWINSGKANEFRIIEASEFITQDGLNNSATKMLPERTTVIAITGATLGQVSLMEISACANQSVVGVPGTSTFPCEFVYFWVKENVAELVSSQTGGAQQHINKNNVNALKLLCPSRDVLAAYFEIVNPLFDTIKTNCFESRTLAAIRDVLLPKLLSGEIRVKDAEKVLNKQSGILL